MSLPTSSRVYRLASRTGPSALQQSTEPLPPLAPTDLLIQLKAVSLNFRDISIADGRYPFPVAANVIPCSDGAGVVLAVGENVRDFQPGDKVVSLFDPTNIYGPAQDWDNGHGGPVDGFLREYAVVSHEAVIKVPDGVGLTFAEIASLTCTGVTSWNALYGNAPLKPGQTVLLQGTGGVSLTALQIARLAGARTILTSSSDSKLASIQTKFGVDHVVNYRTTPQWADEVLHLTGGKGVDYVLENGGSGTIGQSLKCVAMGGQVAVIGFLSPAKQEDMPDVASLALARGAVVRGVVIGSRELYDELLRFVAAKGLRMPVEKVFGFDEVREAYELMSSGGHTGKVCISLE
ncbi:hypothetical protein JCM10207_006224 [Rhodosporidiobolus poonsookiae]